MTFTNLETSMSPTNQQNYALDATYNLTAGKLYVIFPQGVESPFPAGDPTISGSTVSWTLITNSGLFDGDKRKEWALEARPSSTETSVQLTINFPGSLRSGWWSLIEIGSGFDTTTPIAQSKGATGTGTTMTVTLDSAPTAGNASLLAVAGDVAQAVTIDSGFTAKLGEKQNADGAADSGVIETEYDSTAQQTGAPTVSSSMDWGGIHLEIAAAAAAVSLPPFQRWGDRSMLRL